MHLLKCDLKEVTDEMAKLNLKVKQLEMHLDMMNKHYFMHCVDRKSFQETNCVEQQVQNVNSCDSDDDKNYDLDWALKFYNYE